MHPAAHNNAQIHDLELPLASSNSVCGASVVPRHCIDKNISLRSSVLAIIGSHPGVGNVVVFASRESGILGFLDRLWSIRSMARPGAVVSVVSLHTSKRFTVTVHGTGCARTVGEEDMVSIAAGLTRHRRSMTFYLDPELSAYAAHGDPWSMWVSVTSGPIAFSGRYGLGLMQMLYSEPGRDSTLSLNIGMGEV
ncbi:hypothetical protein E4U55_002564 [Claviceps digitariae]|nr:hypothetical protein E4U55_002564 [Claviceps digitariae]